MLQERSTPREMKYFSCAGLELGSKNYLWPDGPLCFLKTYCCWRELFLAFFHPRVAHQSLGTKNTSYRAKTHCPANQSAACLLRLAFKLPEPPPTLRVEKVQRLAKWKRGWFNQSKHKSYTIFPVLFWNQRFDLSFLKAGTKKMRSFIQWCSEIFHRVEINILLEMKYNQWKNWFCANSKITWL
jgi:hypothetical protein